MKVSATTLPRRSLSESRAPSWVVSLKSGAAPIFGRPSPCGAARAMAETNRPPPVRMATIAVVHRLRVFTLGLPFPLELVEETPIGTLRDDLLRARLDHPDLVEAEGVEAHGILRVVLPPRAIRDLLQCLEGVVVVLCVAPVHHETGEQVRLPGAEVDRPEDRAQGPLGGHGVLPHELPIPGHHAAEVLGPGSVHHGVDHHVTDL